MSVVQRVIILNKPFKIRGQTVGQWIILAVALGIALIVGSKIPGDWKLGNLPAGFILGMLIFCGGIVFVNMGKVHSMLWWKNLLLYKLLRVAPTVYLPHSEEAMDYVDATIIEVKKNRDEDQTVDVEDY